jgi:DNA-binding MarR family transcriptional regulator
MARTMPDVPEGGEFALALSTSHLLHRAQQLAADRFMFLVGEDGVTLRQFAVLAAIAETPNVSQADLVRATGIDRSTLADMMVRMEKRGWVTRAPSATDARAKAVALAPAGRKILQSALQHAKAADAAILDALPKGKRKAFQAMLEWLSLVPAKAAEKAEREAVRAARKQERLEAKARAQAAKRKGKRKGKTKTKAKAKDSEPAPRTKRKAKGADDVPKPA